MKKRLKGIVFDLDGTLVNSLGVTFDAFNHGITVHGGRTHTPHEIMKYFGAGETEIFARLIGRENAQAAYEAFQRYTDEKMGEIPLHEGVEELLEKLKSAGVPLSIFTGRNSETTEMILKHHRLRDRFITVVASDHVSMSKPSPEGLYLCLERMKMEPSEVLFVGDSDVDMNAAQAAGAPGVAALWDYLADREALRRHDPEHFAEHPTEIWKIWEGF